MEKAVLRVPIDPVLIFGVGLAALRPLSRPVVRWKSLIGMSVRRRLRRTVFSFQNYVRCLRFRLERGQTFSQAVHDSPYGTAYIETMLTVGEMTGKYDDALTAITVYYDNRLRRWAAGLLAGALCPDHCRRLLWDF